MKFHGNLECSNCHARIEVNVDDVASAPPVKCPSCGATFSLGDELGRAGEALGEVGRAALEGLKSLKALRDARKS